MKVFEPVDFGVVPDQDSTEGFLALGRELAVNRTNEVRVEFPPGRYLTRAPHWLEGVGRVILTGPGVTLQQSQPDYGLFSLSEPFRTAVWAPPYSNFTNEHHAGWRIRTAVAGDPAVRFLTPPVGIAAGAFVLIAGLAQQLQNLHLPEDQWQLNGWPPNLRWFEYRRVIACDGDEAVLDRPLAHDYDEGWPDYPGDYFGGYVAGAPRLYDCNRPGYDMPAAITFRGFNFARAVGSTGGGHVGLSLPAMALTLEDCTFLNDDATPGSTFVQLADQVAMRRCRMGSLEVDKCIRYLLVEDCEVDGDLTSDGAAALEIEVRRTRVSGDFRINPRVSVVIENSLAGSNFSLNSRHGNYYTDDPVVVNLRAQRLGGAGE